MKYTLLFLLVTNSFLMISCGGVKNGKTTIKQGVFGQVVWVQGNMMPSPDFPLRGSGKPVRRMIRIYELTNVSQVDGDAPLYSSVKSTLLLTVKSDKNGHYQAKLLPGKYSIFTVEDDGKLFANSFNEKGMINSVEVKMDEVTVFNININYKAYY